MMLKTRNFTRAGRHVRPMPAALLAIFLCLVVQAQTLDKTTSFLVKLSDPIGSTLGKSGQKIGAVIISPETFLGGRLEGRVRAVAADRIVVEFTTIKHKGKTISITTITTDFVNSIGHPSVDEEGRPVALVQGALTSKTPGFGLNEGAELKLQVAPVRR